MHDMHHTNISPVFVFTPSEQDMVPKHFSSIIFGEKLNSNHFIWSDWTLKTYLKTRGYLQYFIKLLISNFHIDTGEGVISFTSDQYIYIGSFLYKRN